MIKIILFIVFLVLGLFSVNAISDNANAYGLDTLGKDFAKTSVEEKKEILKTFKIEQSCSLGTKLSEFTGRCEFI